MNDGGRDGEITLAGGLDFLQLLWRIHHELQSASKRLEKRAGMTGPQRLVVRILGDHPGVSAGTISRALRLHPSTLTGIFRRLEKRGLIERSPDPNDGRRALFALTPAGRAANASNDDTPDAVLRVLLDNVAPATLASTRQLLDDVAEALEQARTVAA